jgi:type IX secretion system substrate protein
MKKLFTILLSVFAFATKAQPTMTSAFEAIPGLTFNYAYVDSSTATEGPGGANQNWNFSTVVPNGSFHIDQWVAPASTPYAANFPGTNLVQQTVDTGGNTVYLYHNATSSMTDLHGMGFDASGILYIMNNSNTEILREFPATYNTTLSDNFSGLATLSIGPATINMYRYGSYSWIADGYGTLTTPNGVYTNTLRGHVNQYITDSMVYVGIPLPTNIIHHYSNSYFWGCTNPGNRLYQFYIGYDTAVTSTSTIITKSVSYLDAVTAIEETPPYETATAAAYPNPANDYAFITLDNPVNGTAELSLYDLKGSIVKNISAEMKAANRYEWMFPVSDLPGGIYHARITCGGKQWQTKIVKN